MKKLLLLTGLLLITSCSKDEVCDCNKTNYETEQYSYYENGVFKTGTRTIVLNNESVDCTDEGRFETGSNTYYVIKCN